MATPNDVAQRLGIQPSQVTARGLLDHAFPGVVECIPSGPPRDAFVNGLGASLLQAALDDDASDPFRYNGQLQMIRHVLDQPEMQQVLANCRQQGGTPGTTPNPTGSGGGSDGGGPGRIGIGTVLAALALVGATGGMLWWVTHRRPDDLPDGHRANPRALSGSYEGELSLSEHLKSLGVDELITVDVSPGNRSHPPPIVRVYDTATGRLISRCVVEGGSLRVREVVESVAIGRLRADPTIVLAVNMADRSYETVRLAMNYTQRRGRMVRDGDRLVWGGAEVAPTHRSNPGDKPSAKIEFVRVPSEDKSIVEVDIRRHGKSAGSIRAERHETHRALNGTPTYCTGSWVLEFWDENGRNILTEEEAEFAVVGFRPSRRWNVPAQASTAADVARALREAKDAATAWLKAHPDYR